MTLHVLDHTLHISSNLLVDQILLVISVIGKLSLDITLRTRCGTGMQTILPLNVRA